METAYLLLGGNVGNVKEMFHRAVEILQSAGRIVNSSAVYRTAPWGNTRQPDFLNRVIALETSLSARELLESCLKAERSLGRIREEKWGPRPIDIDILLFGDRVINETDLEVPHPRMAERNFVMRPMADTFPGLVHPVLGLTMLEIAQKCPDNLAVERED